MGKSIKIKKGSMSKVNWGIIGVGDVTEIKSGPAFNKVENSNILMVMRRNLEKAEDYAKRHSIPHFTNNADDILNNPEINAVYIATPPSSHYEYTIRAANAKKHVYVEKPMAASYSECKEMIEVCNSNGVKLFVAYYRRELDYFKKIKEVIDTKVIGDIKSVDIKFMVPPSEEDYYEDNLPWRVRPEIAGAGYFYDLASHQFDFLDYLFGPVKSAKGNSTNQLNLYKAEDIVTASYLFESNIIGCGTWCFTMGNNEIVDRAEIIGSRGKVIFSFFNQNPIEIYTQKNTEKIYIEYPQHVQQQLIESVVKNIMNEGYCKSTGLSGARTNWVMDQILNNK
jgi:predicted dehydrogenase